MAKGKRTGKGHALRYTAYKQANKYAANRKRRLLRALKKNPENAQIETAIKDVVYRRSTPTNRHWSATKRQLAILFKEFTGRFDSNILSNNEKVAAPALMSKGWKSVTKPAEFKASHMFSIMTRLSA